MIFFATKSGRKLILQRIVPYSLLTGFMDARPRSHIFPSRTTGSLLPYQHQHGKKKFVPVFILYSQKKARRQTTEDQSECHFAELLVAIHICWRRRPSSLRSTSLCETRDSLWSLQNRQRNDKSKERRTSQTAHFQTVYWPSYRAFAETPERRHKAAVLLKNLPKKERCHRTHPRTTSEVPNAICPLENARLRHCHHHLLRHLLDFCASVTTGLEFYDT